MSVRDLCELDLSDHEVIVRALDQVTCWSRPIHLLTGRKTPWGGDDAVVVSRSNGLYTVQAWFNHRRYALTSHDLDELVAGLPDALLEDLCAEAGNLRPDEWAAVLSQANETQQLQIQQRAAATKLANAEARAKSVDNLLAGLDFTDRLTATEFIRTYGSKHSAIKLGQHASAYAKQRAIPLSSVQGPQFLENVYPLELLAAVDALLSTQ